MMLSRMRNDYLVFFFLSIFAFLIIFNDFRKLLQFFSPAFFLPISLSLCYAPSFFCLFFYLYLYLCLCLLFFLFLNILHYHTVRTGLSEHEVSDVAELLSMMGKAHGLRSTGSTGANLESSRSHQVLYCTLLYCTVLYFIILYGNVLL